MKGTFFQRPLEFNLIVEGETWHQGDAITGSLVVKNHGNDPVELSDVHVDLAEGETKKVRAKSPEAFEVLNTTPMPTARIAPRESTTLDWKFETDRNCPVTDKSGSLYVLYGRGAATEQLGQLELHFKPFPLIAEFVKAVNIQFRFVPKSQKASKRGVEVKLDPPDGQAYASVENLVLYFRFDGDTLEVSYVFNVKGLEATAAAFDVKKKKKELTQTFKREDYLTSTGRVNHERIETAIKTALEQVQAKILF